MGAGMRIYRQRLETIMGVDYVKGAPLPDEAVALGARIVTEEDGSETLITREGEIYPLKDGGVITLRRGKVGFNMKDRLLRRYEEAPDPTPRPTDTGVT